MEVSMVHQCLVHLMVQDHMVQDHMVQDHMVQDHMVQGHQHMIKWEVLLLKLLMVIQTTPMGILIVDFHQDRQVECLHQGINLTLVHNPEIRKRMKKMDHKR
jgi:hypothetical protein